MKNKNTIHKKNTMKNKNTIKNKKNKKKKKIKKIKTKKNMKGGSMMAGAGLLFALGLISGAFSGSMNQVKKPTILNHINNEKLQDIMKRPIGDLDKVSLETFVNAGLGTDFGKFGHTDQIAVPLKGPENTLPVGSVNPPSATPSATPPVTPSLSPSPSPSPSP